MEIRKRKQEESSGEVGGTRGESEFLISLEIQKKREKHFKRKL